MTTHSTTRRLALVAGALATSGALALLLQDAIRSHVWTLEHALIPVLMGVQILTAHLASAAARQWRIGSALGFMIVAAVATWGVLYTSVGKQSHVTAEQATAAADLNRQRADVNRRLAANTEMLDGARARHAAECASGKGKRCDGIAATVNVYADAVAGNRAELARLGPAAPEHTRADAMADLIAAFQGGDRAAIKSRLLLLEPFTYATIFEMVALLSFFFAFGGSRQSTVGSRQSAEPSVGDREQTDFGGIAPATLFAGDVPEPPTPPKPRKRRPPPSNVVPLAGQRRATADDRAHLRAALADVAGPINNHTLAVMMGVSDGEASRRWHGAADMLHVERRGREVLISLRRDARVA